jgi:hypothetical protein
VRSTRRELLRWIGASVAVSTLPLSSIGSVGCGSSSSNGPAPQTGFFTDDERTLLGKLADGVLPPDDQPGGSSFGAVAYIERLLTLFDNGDNPPFVFASGPYSGRTPFANDDGTVGATKPPDDFSHALALDRVTEHAWRLFLFGSDGVTGGGPNDAVLPKIVGLRDQVKDLLRRAQQIANVPPASLDAPALADLMANLTIDDRTLLVDLVAQATFGAPEYGGNPGGAGWTMVHFEGDAQPLGYTQFDTTSGTYKERPDAPMSTAATSDPEPLDDETRAFILSIVVAIGGKEFL